MPCSWCGTKDTDGAFCTCHSPENGFELGWAQAKQDLQAFFDNEDHSHIILSET